MVAAGCLGADDDGWRQKTEPPNLSEGMWWRFESSAGRTFTHRYDGSEIIADVETYRIHVDVIPADQNGFTEYTLWYAEGAFGFMAYRTGPFYSEAECPSGHWFPLDETIEDDCDKTIYANGGTSQ